MRILCVADEFAWPPANGGRIRLANVLRALGEMGSIDCLAVLNDDRPADMGAVPVGAGITRVQVVRSAARHRSAAALVRAALGRLPRRMLWPDWREAAGLVTEWAATGYDLVWFVHADTYAILGRRLTIPMIVDLDNLEGRLLRERRATRPADPTRSAVRRRVADLLDRLDEQRWSRLEQSIVRGGAIAVVCSETDRARLAGGSVAIVPNAYEPSGPVIAALAAGAPADADRPLVILFVGQYLYEPNRDAARRLATEILPLVRRDVPDACLRLVGRGDHMLDDLRGLPGVVVVGEVDDVGPELAQASVAAVPIRFGSGTRVKILEAFAFGVPVVSTALGAEGLDAKHGEHLILADTAEEFAGACTKLHRDSALSSRLVVSARVLWESRYRYASVREAVGRVVKQALGSDQAAGNDGKTVA